MLVPIKKEQRHKKDTVYIYRYIQSELYFLSWKIHRNSEKTARRNRKLKLGLSGSGLWKTKKCPKNVIISNGTSDIRQ